MHFRVFKKVQIIPYLLTFDNLYQNYQLKYLKLTMIHLYLIENKANFGQFRPKADRGGLKKIKKNIKNSIKGSGPPIYEKN